MSAERRKPASRERAPRTLHQVFTTQDLARLAGLAPSRVRRCVHSGLLPAGRGARRRFEFTLRDLLTLRATLPLLEAGVGPRRLSAIASQIRRQLASDRALSSLRISSGVHQSILVSDGHRAWDVDSGQLVLPFSPRSQKSQTQKVVPIDPDANAVDQAREITVLLHRATLLERSDGTRARELYAEVLRRDPTSAVAHVNLGRLLHEVADLPAAEEHYRRALRHDPGNATALFNMAVIAEHRGELRTAARRYRQALAADPSLAEAHQHLSRIFRRLGQPLEARKHQQKFRTTGRTGGSVSRLKPSGPPRKG